MIVKQRLQIQKMHDRFTAWLPSAPHALGEGATEKEAVDDLLKCLKVMSAYCNTEPSSIEL
jgi:hypothetical protein